MRRTSSDASACRWIAEPAACAYLATIQASQVVKQSTPLSLPAAAPAAQLRKKGRPRSKPVGDDGGDGSSGVRAMLVGLSVLRAVGGARRPQPLREIAAASGLAANRVHRYLSSLLAAGFVQQDPKSGDYWLGDAVVEIGLQALGQLDALRVGIEALRVYGEHSGLDGHLSVWGSHGPTVVRWQAGRLGHQLKIEEGRVLPLLWSATGRLMAAYRSESELAPLLKAEIKEWNHEHPSHTINQEQIRTLFAAVRERGFSAMMPSINDGESLGLGAVFPRSDHFGLETVAVPIFDHQGRMPVALTVFGSSQFRLLGNGTNRVTEIADAARAASRKLGYVVPA